MAKVTPGFIMDQEAEASRQRAAGRQKQFKKTNDPSNAMRGSTQVKEYKAATRENWSRAAQEARLSGAARAHAIAKAKGKVGKK